ncbi:hypothetical protein R1sor_012192 [Riccia sorocarpa]|uniref:Glycosyltransferase 61 catalytic domain-containing protein n=1 Tax=Riccia sorocarpa TaxID=122646 RepID=A0ABD3I4C1_9MARC
MMRKLREYRDGNVGVGWVLAAEGEGEHEHPGSRWKSRKGNFIPMVAVFVFTVMFCFSLVMKTRGTFSSVYTYDRNLEQDLSPPREHPYDDDGKEFSKWPEDWQSMLPGALEHEAFFCDRHHIRTDVCRLHGNVHLEPDGKFVLHSEADTTPIGHTTVKPYTRKWEKNCMQTVEDVKLESVRSSGNGNSSSTAVCNVRHSVPAVVFSTSGYTGNVYHEFHDGMIPLYITTQHLNREVVLIVSDFHDWWLEKYADILQQLTNYEILDLRNLTGTHCFSDVTVGLFIHEELSITPSIMPQGKSMRDFRALLDRAFNGDVHWAPGDINAFTPVQAKHHQTKVMSELVIIVREGTRILLDLDKVVNLATSIGFNVVLLKPNPRIELKKLFWVLSKADVVMGVHGAAMSHFLFMNPGKVLIQVVPLGTDWAANTYYGGPAEKMGLQYIPYKITPEESTLSKKYSKDDPILTDPDSVGKQGWDVIKEIYLEGQDVELSLPRFQKTLEEAKQRSMQGATPHQENLSKLSRRYGRAR